MFKCLHDITGGRVCAIQGKIIYVLIFSKFLLLTFLEMVFLVRLTLLLISGFRGKWVGLEHARLRQEAHWQHQDDHQGPWRHQGTCCLHRHRWRIWRKAEGLWSCWQDIISVIMNIFLFPERQEVCMSWRRLTQRSRPRVTKSGSWRLPSPVKMSLIQRSRPCLV